MTAAEPRPVLRVRRRDLPPGLGDERPALPTDPGALEDPASERLEPGPFGYVAGGAGAARPMRANRDAFDRWRIVPRMLRDATERDLVDHRAGHADAGAGAAGAGRRAVDRAPRRGAGGGPGRRRSWACRWSSRPPSSHTIEEVAAASGRGPALVPAVLADRGRGHARLLDRAAAAGYTALVVTLDTWTLGWRPHRPRPGLPAVPARRRHGDPVHRPGVPGRAGAAARGRPDGRRGAAGCRCSPAPPCAGTAWRCCASTGTARSC